MVAPTRKPQARGVKCAICKQILLSATWLDQTKLAKDVQEAEKVLKLIKEHNVKGCPCIPKNIETLLVGSTHFEIHRLVAKQLDHQVHKRQMGCYLQTRQRALNEASRNKKQIINDCPDGENTSRFRIYRDYCDKEHVQQSKCQLEHLVQAINYWQMAMEDQTNPFNSKLAHRLGLTHHVIYACYLFKYYKILDYQLIAANLLVNVFRSIEGVTAHAIQHAHFLLVKALIDCDQLQLARHYLDQATRSSNPLDKSHYESILLNCVACELDLLEGSETVHDQLNELAELAKIMLDDKLQHYYARTSAIDILMKFIHRYPSKSDQCFEFFHAYRYVCAIIRRCYETSFEIVLGEKDTGNKQAKPIEPKEAQVLDHSWIRYAVCDFAYSTFEHLAEFYIRAGMPECLELLYNGLGLISFRNGGVFWQSKMACIGAQLDLLCDKEADAKAKLNVAELLVGQYDSLTKQPSRATTVHVINLLRVEMKVCLTAILEQQGFVISMNVIDSILTEVGACQSELVDRLNVIELFDLKSNAFTKLTASRKEQASDMVLGGSLGHITLLTLKIGVTSALREGSRQQAITIINEITKELNSHRANQLTYFDCQTIWEMLLRLAEVDNSGQKLLDAINASDIFLEFSADKLSNFTQQFSNLEVNGKPEKTKTRKSSKIPKTQNVRADKVPLKFRASKRSGFYDVAQATGDSEIHEITMLEVLASVESLTNEEIVTAYLKNSEPSPDYNLFRRAHELMLSFRLLDKKCHQDAVLFHFSESMPSHTMRYRWMMMDEQQLSPFDQSKSERLSSNDKPEGATCARQLSFCNPLANNVRKYVTMSGATKPDAFRLVQFRHLFEQCTGSEHLLCVSAKCDEEPIFMRAKRTRNQGGDEGRPESTTIPMRVASLIDKSKESLQMISSHSTRAEKRNRLDEDFSAILRDIESDWLGPFRFLMCGDLFSDFNYGELIENLEKQLGAIMKMHSCRSRVALRLALENAALLRRDEFLQVISILYDCTHDSEESRECYNVWLKSLEEFMSRHNLGSSKLAMLQALDRVQLGLILDNNLALIPFESLKVVTETNQGIFRVPSLRLLWVISATRRCTPIRVDPSEVAYVLDPANNLAKTRERFDQKLKAQADWLGSIGVPPNSEELEQWLTTKQLYIFLGHGAGTAYYNKLCKGRGLSHVRHITSAAIVMGCSSGRMLAEGPRLEPFGIGWVFVFRGAPCYLGLLWDVTDTDIDKYLDVLLDKWLPSISWSTPAQELNSTTSCRKAITNVSTQARQSCRLKMLVGAAPVHYGLPIWCKN